MASIEFIQKRITGKEKELDKLEKKLARIRKAEAGGWEVNNPYLYNHYDLRRCLKDIEVAQKGLAEYKAQLVAETEKANSRDVKVIVEFLEGWKARVKQHYLDGLIPFFADMVAVRAAYNAANQLPYGTPEQVKAYDEYEEMHKKYMEDVHGKYETHMIYNHYRKREEKHQVKVAAGKYEYLNPYSNERTLEDAIKKLDADLEKEATRKYDFIIERTNAIVGTITDAGNLSIGEKEDLNGYIIGTKGTAKIQTIGAGGYNIQCFHFRTLINAMK